MKKMKKNKFLTIIAVVSIAVVAFFTGCNKSGWDKQHGLNSDNYNLKGGHQTQVNSPVPLGTAASFAVLGGETVTNAETSVITGDLGVSPGSAITGFDLLANTIVGPGTVTDGLGIVNGTIYAGGPVAAQAHNDAIIAYNYLMAQAITTQKPAAVIELGGLTLTPGVYNFPISARLGAGEILTLDFQGNSDAVFIFQITSTLVTFLDSKVVATGTDGATTCLGSNVFWAVGSSATINGAEFIGTVIANTTITMTTAANTAPLDSTAINVFGRMLALHGEVTMVNENISTCGTSVGGKHNPKPCRDFVTGGGWIVDANGDKATFGVSGGIKNTFWGQLSFNDHNGTKIKSTQVTGYAYINATTREIRGFANVNGVNGVKYIVTVSDNGEPGRGDTFSIVLVGASVSTSYRASGTLTGGNIQLHKECGDKKDGHERDLGENYNDKDESDGHKNCESHDEGYRR